jgi:hypothetical protein
MQPHCQPAPFDEDLVRKRTSSLIGLQQFRIATTTSHAGAGWQMLLLILSW